MKITKRQLKRIIAEEKRKLIKESVADMRQMEAIIDDSAVDVAQEFNELMVQMAKEDPDLVSDIRSWNEEAYRATMQLEAKIATAINSAVQEIETMLHNGAFKR